MRLINCQQIPVPTPISILLRNRPLAIGTATLVFVLNRFGLPVNLWVEADPGFDWYHSFLIPELTPIGSYYHYFGFDFAQAITLLHSVPLLVWIALWLYPLQSEHFPLNSSLLNCASECICGVQLLPILKTHVSVLKSTHLIRT